MPQLKHGGRIMFLFAVTGSKFEGTGFENEQITQTQVALLGLGVLAPEARFEDGLATRLDGRMLGDRIGEGDAMEALEIFG